MARPKRLRRLEYLPTARSFHASTENGCLKKSESVVLTMDEFESLRLADLEKYSQEEAAKKMLVSRATFGRIVESAREKIAKALVNGYKIEIDGGAFRFGNSKNLECPRCKKKQARRGIERERIECNGCHQPLQNTENN